MVRNTITFLIATFICMALIGGVQKWFGVFHVYHPEEEAYEIASPETYSQTNSQKKIRQIAELLLTRRSEIQNYINSLPRERSQAFVTKINFFITSYDTERIIPPFSSRIYETHATDTIQESQTIKHEARNNSTWYPNIQNQPKEKEVSNLYRTSILDIFLSDFFQKTLFIFDVIIDHNRVHPRGQMRDMSITLSAHIISVEEMIKVLVHEIGHIVDIYVLKKNNSDPDPSYAYYRINWEDVNTQKPGSSTNDFLSGYSATNQYEDFAEAFTMYVFHNNEFVRRAKHNHRLREKYVFLENNVFGNVFQGTGFEVDPIPDYVWDVTKVIIFSFTGEKLFSTKIDAYPINGESGRYFGSPMKQ